MVSGTTIVRSFYHREGVAASEYPLPNLAAHSRTLDDTIPFFSASPHPRPSRLFQISLPFSSSLPVLTSIVFLPTSLPRPTSSIFLSSCRPTPPINGQCASAQCPPPALPTTAVKSKCDRPDYSSSPSSPPTVLPLPPVRLNHSFSLHSIRRTKALCQKHLFTHAV